MRREGTVVTLTGMEYRVIEYLAHRRGAVVTKTELLEHLYDFNWERFSNVIEVYISGLRRKLENEGRRQSHSHDSWTWLHPEGIACDLSQSNAES